jgi:hypothetical protein
MIKSEYQTKIWRQQQEWYYNGKRNECEKFQIRMLHQDQFLGLNLIKTTDRINTNTLEIRSKNRYDSIFEYTENFDRLINFKNFKIYFNLKFVCDRGGSQTRTLRETYNFINLQLKFLQESKAENIYFINILDGDESFRCMNDMRKIIDSSPVYNKYVYIGDMHNFMDWFRNLKENLK